MRSKTEILRQINQLNPLLKLTVLENSYPQNNPVFRCQSNPIVTMLLREHYFVSIISAFWQTFYSAIMNKLL